MVTPDQWIIPFNIVNGLTRMPMQPSTDADPDTLPHVIITSDDTFDPVLDHSIDIENDMYHPPWILPLMKKNSHLLINAHP